MKKYIDFNYTNLEEKKTRDKITNQISTIPFYNNLQNEIPTIIRDYCQKNSIERVTAKQVHKILMENNIETEKVIVRIFVNERPTKKDIWVKEKSNEKD